MTTVEDLRNERLKKIELLKSHGMNPYTNDSWQDTDINEFISDFNTFLSDGKKVAIAGRVMSKRVHGKLAFIDLYDGTGKLQCVIKTDNIGDDEFIFFNSVVDSGDFLDIKGHAFVTQKGVNSLLVKDWRMLTKSIRPLPDAWYGIKDEEFKLRQRALDILLNQEVKEMFIKRSLFWKTMRNFLLAEDFIEVETPVIETTTGGAEARPFVTHHNALDIEVYLRISAGELWQKRLMVAGFTRVFEIGRIFRNEGMSNEHLQDYTQMEFYMAYKDYNYGMKMIRDLYLKIVDEVFGTRQFVIRGMEVNFDSEWEKISFVKIIQDKFNIDPLNTTKEEVHAALERERINFDSANTGIGRGVDLLWKKIRKDIAGPAFLIDVPVYMEPLAKKKRDNDKVVERFQVLIAGSEMGKGFSELNDPIDQAERFKKQQALRDAGDEEAQMADMDYVETLEYGMPPTFGFGVSERFFSFLMNKNVREAQIFPLMKPNN